MTDEQTIGRYRLIERVGRGGMGVVYRGLDPVLDREVAVKVMTNEFASDGDDAKDRFFREARAAAKLQHRNIVTIFEFAEDAGVPYIVMEFLRGRSLSERIKTGPPLTVSEKIDIVAELCAGLQYAHDHGVIHRDVKPPNVWLLEDGKVKLLDFGIARMASSTLTRTGDVLGSASYMAPEQVMGQPVDGRADVFSAAVVLYELLGGRRPFDGDAPTATLLRIMQGDAVPIESIVGGLPQALIDAVNRGLKKDPAERYQSAADFEADLQLARMALTESSAANDDEMGATRVMQATIRLDRPATAKAGGALPSASVGAAASAPAVESAPPAERSARWMIWAGAAAVVALAGWLGVSAFTNRRGGAPDGASRAAALPASLQISSDPAGAQIFVDGRDTGRLTPAPIPIEGDGPRQIRLVKDGFQPSDAAVDTATLARGTVSYQLLPTEKIRVNVAAKGPYPFEIVDGQQIVSKAATSHTVVVDSPTTLRLRAPAYLLDSPVSVTGGDGETMNVVAPGLGHLTVRSSRETCRIVANGFDLGFPPVNGHQAAAGTIRLELRCPGNQVVRGDSVTIEPGQSVQARVP